MQASCSAPVLERLTGGDAEPVFVLDFQRVSSAPRFGELLSVGNSGHPIYQADPVGYLQASRDYQPLADMAVLYADAFLGAEAVATAVTIVGYCSAAALSLRIAERVARSYEVRIILVRPTWPDDAMIGSEFARLRADLGAAETACPDLSQDNASILRRMEQLLGADLRAMITARNLHEPSVMASGLLARSLGWLGFLLACREDVKAPWRDVPSPEVITGTAGAPPVPWIDPGAYPVTRVTAPAEGDDEDRLLADLVLSPTRGRGVTVNGSA